MLGRASSVMTINGSLIVFSIDSLIILLDDSFVLIASLESNPLDEDILILY